MTDYIVPLILLGISLIALARGQNGYDIMLQGASEGLGLIRTILPSLILLLTAVHMLRSSGAIDLISQFASPVFRLFGIPPETAPLILIRPISGSAALAVGAELMAEYGVDSVSLVKMIVDAEAAFDVKFDDRELALNKYENFDDVIDTIEKKLQ